MSIRIVVSKDSSVLLCKMFAGCQKHLTKRESRYAPDIVHVPNSGAKKLPMPKGCRHHVPKPKAPKERYDMLKERASVHKKLFETAEAERAITPCVVYGEDDNGVRYVRRFLA
jgi:hypothetical protein